MRTPRDPIYAGHRYPAENIRYAVWLHFRFPLSLRDQDGFVLDVLVQSRRDKEAANRLFRKLLKKQWSRRCWRPAASARASPRRQTAPR